MLDAVGGAMFRFMTPIAAVQFYDVVVFFHILAVVIGFGPTFAYAMFASVAARDGLRSSLSVERAVLQWNMTGTTLGMTVILLSGFYLVADGHVELQRLLRHPGASS